MAKDWSAETILNMARGFQPACILAAAVDLDVFSALADNPMTSSSLAQELAADKDALGILLDALAALGLLIKHEDRYHVPEATATLLTEESSQSVLLGVRHLSNCLRRWSQLARVVQQGGPAERSPSIRGAQADTASFIGAMQVFTRDIIPQTLERLQPLTFQHLLDVGGASGNWTEAFLLAQPEAKATLFDLPEVKELAQQHLGPAGLLDRVTLVAGDYNTDNLPTGADFAWVSAITHQNSREQNRSLFLRIHRALAPGGIMVIRDIIMESNHVHPVAGALFAVNMLVGTHGGGTFTLDEYTEDLTSAGFSEVHVLSKDEGMNSLIKATKG